VWGSEFTTKAATLQGGLVVKHFDTVELSVAVATVLAVAGDAMLVTNHLSKLGAHSVTALAPEFAQSRVKKKPGGGEHAGEKRAGRSGEI
jgi:hypothetical protein